MEETLILVNGYDRKRKEPVKHPYRRMTKAEILALSGHAEFIGNDGTVQNIKINGKVDGHCSIPPIHSITGQEHSCQAHSSRLLEHACRLARNGK